MIMLIVTSSAQMTSSVNISSYGAIKVLLPLHVSGMWIVDANGNRVQLRGAGGDYVAYGNTAWLQQYIQWMKKTGCNSIRLAFTVPNNGSWSSPSQTQYDPTLMDYVLSLLQQNGLYAILDCHEYYAINDTQGWTSVLPTYEQAWINCWVSIANRYKNNPAIAIYQLANEFVGPNATMTRQYFYDCINAIRATGDNHIVMCYYWTGEVWTSPDQILPNMCVDIHGGYNFGHTVFRGGNWFPEDDISSPNQNIAAELYASCLIGDYVQNARATLGCPVVIGELTFYPPALNNMSAPDVYCDQLVVEMAEQYGIPWIQWELDAWIQYAPTFWTDFVNQKLGGAFTSPYVPDSVPVTQTFDMKTFPALPFNIWQHMDASQDFINYAYNVKGTNMVYKTEGVYPLSFHGPCTLRVQTWGDESKSQPYWGTVSSDTIITLAANETLDATAQLNTVIYAWANSPTYLPLPNS